MFTVTFKTLIKGETETVNTDFPYAYTMCYEVTSCTMNNEQGAK